MYEREKVETKSQSSDQYCCRCGEYHADTATSGEGTIHLKLKMHERKNWLLCNLDKSKELEFRVKHDAG